MSGASGPGFWCYDESSGLGSGGVMSHPGEVGEGLLNHSGQVGWGDRRTLTFDDLCRGSWPESSSTLVFGMFRATILDRIFKVG